MLQYYSRKLFKWMCLFLMHTFTKNYFQKDLNIIESVSSAFKNACIYKTVKHEVFVKNCSCDALFLLILSESFTRLKFWAYHRSFDLRKSPANTLTPLSPNVNNANISSNR